MSLYREYLDIYKSSQKQISNHAPKSASQASSRKNRKEKNSPKIIPEIIRNIPPLYDPEISRRLNIPTLPDSKLENVVLLSVPMASLGAPFMSNNGKYIPADSAPTPFFIEPTHYYTTSLGIW